jgi:Tol biopolymer transport system component
VLTRAVAAALGMLWLAAVPAEAQYFGRNNVQYDRFEFRVLQTPNFDIYYYEDKREAAHLAAQLAERWYARLSEALDHTFTRRQPIILYASHNHFAQTTILRHRIGEGVGGFMDHFAGRIVMPFAPGLGPTNHVLGHELVHAFQRDILRQRGRSMASLPLWFTEGMAEHLAVGTLDANTRMWLRDAAEQNNLPNLKQLENPKWFPYRYGQALWHFVAERYGHDAVVRALKSRAAGGAAGRLRDATGDDPAAIVREWHAAMRALEKPEGMEAAAAASAPATRRIVSQGRNGGRLNVGPALSPDGKHLVFLSERDGFSVDVFLADATTGAIVRKLVSTAVDPHFDSLQFLESAGAWDTSGRHFVLAMVRNGEPVLHVYDMPRGRLAREIPASSVDQVFTPAWSPDGRYIAFSGMSGGFSDLYTVSLADGAVRQLTDDPYSDLQPHWSPDGTTVAFASDRFSTSLEALTFGPYQIATLDIESGRITRLGGVPGAKNINPQWSADGAHVYFVSDAGGASNVHRVDVGGGEIERVSRVRTGVTGVTALSPALSLGAGGARLAMSVYARGHHEIHVLDLESVPDEHLAAVPSVGPLPDATALAAALPGMSASAGVGEHGQPQAFTSRPYVPKLSLAAIGQPYLSAGGGAFGGFFRAGMSFSFGDMLGEQQLSTAVQGGKSVTDFAVQSAYVNRRSRLNWGIVGGHIPVLYGLTERVDRGSHEGNDAVLKHTTLSYQTHRRVSGLVSYPLSRGQRIEASAGFDSIAYDRRVVTSAHAVRNGNVLDRTTSKSSLEGATLFETSAALVYDTSVFGPTSPVLGQRYRFGIAPSFGDLRVVTTTADYRRYLMPVRPFTIAARVQHIGRFGPDKNDVRLLPLVWTLRDAVRGFEMRQDTYRTTELATVNTELRFPLLGVVQRKATYGSVPIEGLVFSDLARLVGPGPNGADDRSVRTLWSAGAGARVNAGGFVFEFALARPIMPSAGWRFAANFRPGF